MLDCIMPVALPQTTLVTAGDSMGPTPSTAQVLWNCQQGCRGRSGAGFRLESTRVYECWYVQCIQLSHLHAYIIPSVVQNINAGARHSCGVDINGKGYCWGDNTNGQFRYTTNTYSAVPNTKIITGQLDIVKPANGGDYEWKVTC